MIHGVFGKLGSGKGLLVMDVIAAELTDGFRDVVTNVPVRTAPWVNGQGIPQIGLRSYLLEKLHPLPDYEVDEILKRVLVVEDIEKGGDLFMWRRDGDTGEWFKLTVTKNDEKGRPERFDAEEIKLHHCAPILCVTDEAWQFYPNSGGWARVPLLPFYARQQRKLRDEWFIVTQHPTDVDAVLWNIAQDFWVCRNHGMERMGLFRQPAMFRVIVYSTNPVKGNAIRQREMYRRLDKKLSQCYDTTAGVGIAGGFAGDSNQKKKGLSIVWLGLAVLLMVFALMAVPSLLGKGAGRWIKSTTQVKDANSWAGMKTTAVASAQAIQPGVASDRGRSGTNESRRVTMVGWWRMADIWGCRLSDGREFRNGDARVWSVGPDQVTVEGVRFDYVPLPKTVESTGQASASYAMNNRPITEFPEASPIGSKSRPVRIISEGLRRGEDGVLRHSLPRRVN